MDYLSATALRFQSLLFNDLVQLSKLQVLIIYLEELLVVFSLLLLKF